MPSAKEILSHYIIKFNIFPSKFLQMFPHIGCYLFIYYVVCFPPKTILLFAGVGQTLVRKSNCLQSLIDLFKWVLTIYVEVFTSLTISIIH